MKLAEFMRQNSSPSIHPSRQTESDTYEPTVQTAQVGLKNMFFPCLNQSQVPVAVPSTRLVFAYPKVPLDVGEHYTTLTNCSDMTCNLS